MQDLVDCLHEHMAASAGSVSAAAAAVAVLAGTHYNQGCCRHDIDQNLRDVSRIQQHYEQALQH